MGKKNVSYEEISGKISSPKISSGNFGSNSPSRGNFEAQNFRETRGNFTRKFYEEILGSLDNRTEIIDAYYVHTTDVFSAVLTHASSHTNVAPRALTNVPGRTAVLAGMMVDFFVFSPGSSRSG